MSIIRQKPVFQDGRKPIESILRFKMGSIELACMQHAVSKLPFFGLEYCELGDVKKKFMYYQVAVHFISNYDKVNHDLFILGIHYNDEMNRLDPPRP